MHNKNRLVAHVIYIALYGTLVGSTIILYNSANLVELVYVGLVVIVFGVVFVSWSSKSRKKGQIGESTGKEGLVESGAYSFVRHPEFLGHILIIFALVIISQHWISLVIGAILVVLLCFAMIEEEQRNIEKFGEAYKEYMKRVPRINLLLGIMRKMRKKT